MISRVDRPHVSRIILLAMLSFSVLVLMQQELK